MKRSTTVLPTSRHWRPKKLALLLAEERTPESLVEAKKRYEVIAGETEHYGPAHVKAQQLKKPGAPTEERTYS